MIIPFFIPHAGCPHQCVFCNQKNISGHYTAPAPSDIPARIEQHLMTCRTSDPVEIAFYGGSFTALPVALQKAYLDAAIPSVETGRVSSLRISTRPDAITTENLKLLRSSHVSTVELGVQSFEDRILSLSGRGHTSADTLSSVALLRKEGFTIGLQLMAGLPEDSETTFLASVRQAVEHRPDFVRLYPTLVIRDTPLEGLWSSGRYRPLSLEEAVDLCARALTIFEEARIPVIRIGLQASDELSRQGTVLAGPFHPAFGQIVESSVFLEKMRKVLGKGPMNRSVRIAVNPVDLSTALGQKRTNVNALKAEYGLDSIRIIADAEVPGGSLRLLTS